MWSAHRNTVKAMTIPAPHRERAPGYRRGRASGDCRRRTSITAHRLTVNSSPARRRLALPRGGTHPVHAGAINPWRLSAPYDGLCRRPMAGRRPVPLVREIHRLWRYTRAGPSGRPGGTPSESVIPFERGERPAKVRSAPNPSAGCRNRAGRRSGRVGSTVTPPGVEEDDERPAVGSRPHLEKCAINRVIRSIFSVSYRGLAPVR